ncbi:MAG: efflux RND transporter periplasmic adaptor subunit [Chthoniobacteraceae bacterium]|jgi:putative peptide zinc metalloprotease protein
MEATTAAAAAKGFDFNAALPRLRSDLRISRQIYRNKVSYVVKDPVALKYYRLGEMEMYFGGLMDGKRTVREIIEQLRREFPWEPIDIERLEETFKLFFHLSLLQSDPVMATRVSELAREHKKKAGKSLGSLGMLIFYFRVPLCDPDILLFHLDKRLGFLWTRTALAVQAVLLSVALWTVFNNIPKLEASFGNLLTLHNIFLIWATMMAAKIFHEFGHGLACKHFGGEVHEMGAAFILMSPFLFCDATDSWMFADKRRKLIVTMGGIYIELFIASVAALIWANTDRGAVNQLAYNLMVVCSITTVLFNANPLMRFDGYYALADLLDVPNLREKARRYVLACATTAAVGGAPTHEMKEIHEEGLPRRVIFTLFAIASYLYTYFIVFRVIKVVGRKLEPIGLAKWGQGLEIAFCATGIIIPLYAFGREIRARAKKNPGILMNARVLRFLGITALVVAAIALCPWTVNVTTEFVLYDGNRAEIHAESAGFIRKIAVKTGDSVKAGEVLALLENNDLENRRRDIEDDLKSNYIERRVAVADGDASAMNQARMALGNLLTAKQRLDHDCDMLVLRSPIDGKIETEDLDTQTGEYMEPGQVFCDVIPSNRLQVRIALTEREAGLVKTQQKLEFRTYAFPGRVFTGVVSKVYSSVSDTLPSEVMAARAGGDVPTGLDAQGRERPLLPTFQAELEIDNPDGLLRPGMSGRGKIKCEQSRLGAVFCEHVEELIKAVL